MSKIPKTYLFIGISGILGVISIICFVFYIFQSIKDTANEMVLDRNSLAVLEADAKSLEIVETQLQERKENLEKINFLFVDAEVPIEFIGYLKTLASGSGVAIKIYFSPVNQSVPWPSLNFQLTVEGSFQEFSEFLEKLESSPYLVETQSLNVEKMKAKDGADSLNDVSAAISVIVFAKVK